MKILSAKHKFMTDLFKIMKKEPELVLFSREGVPIYSFNKPDDKIQKYELIHISSTRYVIIRSDKKSYNRMKILLDERLVGDIDDITVLYKDGTEKKYENDSWKEKD